MSDGDHHAFWADDVADEIESRDVRDPIVIKGAVSPSGVPHVGHANEILRGYFVASVLRERGHEVRQVFVADDRDGLRKLPRRLADADWNLVDLGDVDASALGRNLGVPYSDVPDPFGDCHESYGDHFTALLAESAEMVGVPIEVRSTTDLYESGAFDDVVREVLEKRDLASDVLSAYQAGVDDDYVPFMAQCAECERLTTGVTDVDLEAGTVRYECTGMEAGGQRIEGCGHVGTASFRDGKLPWRFEWPAGWKVLGVDFEPFGKDHAEGSWPSGKRIAREVLEFEPPVPMTYEWFTLNGEALSSSSGNVVTVPDLLELLEPEVLRYFFAKHPRKQRDLDLPRVDLLVDEFDRVEATFFGEVDAGDREHRFAERAYPIVVGDAHVRRLDPSRRYETRVEADVSVGGAFDVTASVKANDAIRYEVAGDPTLAERWFRDAPHVYDDLERPGHLRRRLQEVAINVRNDGVRRFGDRVRFPYTFAAVLGMTDDRYLRREMARRQGHLEKATPDWAADAAMARVERARRWAERMENAYDYRLQVDLPDVTIDEDVRAALRDLADASLDDGEALQGEIYETAKRHGVEPGDVFSAGYRLFLGQPRGPRLGPFLAELDEEFVARRLRLEE